MRQCPRPSVRCALTALLLLLVPLAAAAQTPPCGVVTPQQAARGEQIRVTFAGGPFNRAHLTFAGEERARGAREPSSIPEAAVALADGVGSLRVPDTLPLGGYRVEATLFNDGAEPTAPAGGTQATCTDGRLEVVTPATAQLRLFEFQPPGTYEVEPVDFPPAEGETKPTRRDTVRLTLRGTGFLTDIPADNKIIVNGGLIDVDWGAPCAAVNNSDGRVVAAERPRGRVVSAQEIALCYVPIRGAGADVAVQQYNVAPTAASRYRVYGLDTTGVGVTSALIALLLAGLVVWLAFVFMSSGRNADRKKWIQILFVDKESDTYSLSKLQFYLWTMAAIFGYTYLTISRRFIQDQPWPDVPGNLPGIIAIGAGTAVGAQVVSNLRGPKGAGQERPNVGDFVMSGGVAAADRVQMLVWTLLGVGLFIMTVLQHRPGEIETLDTVPEGLLLLMGISSAGYLGGKLARNGGPVINEISISPSEPDAALGWGDAAATSTDVAAAAARAKAAAEKLSPASTPAAVKSVAALTRLAETGMKVKTWEEAFAFCDSIPAARAEADAAAEEAARPFAGDGTGSRDAARQAEIAEKAVGAIDDLADVVTPIVRQRRSRPPGAPAFTRIIELRGRNLSNQAIFDIDGIDLPFRMLKPDPRDPTRRQPEIVIPEAEHSDRAVLLRLSIDPAQLEMADLKNYQAWFGKATGKEQRFRIINRDGQQAEKKFTMPPGEAQSAVKTGDEPVRAGGAQ